MKNAIFLIVFLLFGCQEFVMVSPPRLTGGKWVFVDYDIVVISSISEVKIIKSDTICINSFNNESFVSGGVLMKQYYNLTQKDRRFIKNKTIWEFDNCNYYLYCDFININGSLKPLDDPFTVNIHPYSKIIAIDNWNNGSITNYTYETNDYGASPPTVMKLLSPPIITDLYLSNGTRDKAVTIRVILTFMR